MLWTNTKRVVRSGFVNFWRNGFVSLSSILVMTITLFVLGSLIFTYVLLNGALIQIKDKVDINVYFVTTAKEEDIKSIQKSLETLPEVSKVVYSSREDVLADFKKRHENDQFTLQALDELQENPLGAILNVKAKDPSQYAGIVRFLESKSVSQTDGLPIVDKINYNQNKVAIDKLTRIIDSGQRLGLFLLGILIVISIMITFNTIRLAIYISRDEIAVMRLVGASSKYIRGPFVIIGIMYGIFSAIITGLIFLPATYYLGRATANFFTGINVYNYYITHFQYIFPMLLGAGALIGAVSSYMAVRRYLQV
ncbi:ABC transporter permease [Candidatus Parcubacteria bacterium]|nr:ABC transporter permease [Candidatus Parcubacteria bacterium]